MTNIGKPYEGKPHVRFDEEGLGFAQPFTLERISVDVAHFYGKRMASWGRLQAFILTSKQILENDH
jgi:hypothetical protein